MGGRGGSAALRWADRYRQRGHERRGSRPLRSHSPAVILVGQGLDGVEHRGQLFVNGR